MVVLRATNYQIAEHLRLLPTRRGAPIEKVIAIDPGELFTGVAVWDLRGNRKETFTITASDFDEMIGKVVSFLRSTVAENTYIICEMTFIQHPSAVFVWQMIGIIRYLYRSRLCAATPTQANKGAFGYGRIKLSAKKKILKERGWEGLKDDHQVAAATLAEFFVNRFGRNLFK